MSDDNRGWLCFFIGALVGIVATILAVVIPFDEARLFHQDKAATYQLWLLDSGVAHHHPKTGNFELIDKHKEDE